MKRIIFFITIWIGVCFYRIGQISKNVTTKLSDLNIERIDEYNKISLAPAAARLYRVAYKGLAQEQGGYLLVRADG